MTINVYAVVGDEFCVLGDGVKVYEQIAVALRAGRKVNLSFQNIEHVTCSFLNSAIGRLYYEFTEELIRANFSVCDMSQSSRELLQRVVSNAKEFHAMKRDRGDERESDGL